MVLPTGYKPGRPNAETAPAIVYGEDDTIQLDFGVSSQFIIEELDAGTYLILDPRNMLEGQRGVIIIRPGLDGRPWFIFSDKFKWTGGVPPIFEGANLGSQLVEYYCVSSDEIIATFTEEVR